MTRKCREIFKDPFVTFKTIKFPQDYKLKKTRSISWCARTFPIIKDRCLIVAVIMETYPYKCNPSLQCQRVNVL